jgi:hypothetical protein
MFDPGISEKGGGGVGWAVHAWHTTSGSALEHILVVVVVVLK